MYLCLHDATVLYIMYGVTYISERRRCVAAILQCHPFVYEQNVIFLSLLEWKDGSNLVCYVWPRGSSAVPLRERGPSTTHDL